MGGWYEKDRNASDLDGLRAARAGTGFPSRSRRGRSRHRCAALGFSELDDYDDWLYGLVAHDFSIAYVAQVGSRETPLFYTVISLWGALEGSILFWAWVLGLYSTLVIYQNRNRPGTLVPYAGVSLLLISAFFLVFLFVLGMSTL